MTFFAWVLFLATLVNPKGTCLMPSSKCAASDVVACESHSGCRWHTASSGTCTYPDRCTQSGTKCSAGCIYLPDSSSCSRPDGDYCKTFIEKDNCWSHGCEWSPSLAGCSPPSKEDCQYRSETCTAANGCKLEVEKTTGSCKYSTNPCDSLTAARLCNMNSVCQWKYSFSSCHPPQQHCERIIDFSTCKDTAGCDWQPGGTGSCQFPDCEMNLTSICENLTSDCERNVTSICENNLTSDCESNLTSICGNNLTSDCESNLTSICGNNFTSDCFRNLTAICEQRAGCQLVGDLCTVKNSTSCDSKNKTECQDRPDEGCNWVADGSGSCVNSFTTGDCDFGNCVNDCDLRKESCENQTSSLGCEWHLTAGFCTRKLCQANDNGTDCDNESVAAGCEWEPPTQREYCSPINTLSCKDNIEKNGCDASSETGCVWKSPDNCHPDPELRCYGSSDGTECDSASKAVGCTWQTFVGSCLVNKGLQCNNNIGNTECDTESSGHGCVWHSAADASCGAIDDVCVSNNDNTTCSDASKTKGCEWIKDEDEVVNNVASISLVPTVILFTLIALLL